METIFLKFHRLFEYSEAKMDKQMGGFDDSQLQSELEQPGYSLGGPGIIHEDNQGSEEEDKD